jgi:methylmalonyl-CoA mutase C-terminal domain/subunit
VAGGWWLGVTQLPATSHEPQHAKAQSCHRETDGHDRGAKVIARALRDAGMEVIYTGLRQTPEQIVSAALQEDADVIGLSILSGAHNHIAPKLMQLLKEKGLEDVLVLVGGIIPDVDIPRLKEIGVKGVFLPGTPMQEIIEFINSNARARV